MELWGTSDLHLNPGDVFPNYTGLDYLIVNGDLLNILPLGMNQWRTDAGKRTCQSIAAGLPKKHCLIYGNHCGRLSWMKELLEEPFGLNVQRQLDFIDDDDKIWHFEHGHRFTQWWILRHGADDVVEWLTSNSATRQWWFKFCVKKGWIPSKYMHDWEGNPVSKWRKLVGHYWAMILTQAFNTGKNYVVGHSHVRPAQTIFDIEGIKVIDLGFRELTRII